MYRRVDALQTGRTCGGLSVLRTGIEHEERDGDPLLLQPLRGGEHARVRGFGERDPRLQRLSARADACEEGHFANLARKATAVAGCTSPVTSPPNFAISRTRLELM